MVRKNLSYENRCRERQSFLMTHALPESGESGFPPGQGTCNINLYYITTLLGIWRALKGIISAEVRSLASVSLLLNPDIRSSPNSPINLLSLKPLPKAETARANGADWRQRS